jgi:hypothetical protein
MVNPSFDSSPRCQGRILTAAQCRCNQPSGTSAKSGPSKDEKRGCEKAVEIISARTLQLTQKNVDGRIHGEISHKKAQKAQSRAMTFVPFVLFCG